MKKTFNKRPYSKKHKKFKGPKDEGLLVYVHDDNVDSALSRLRKRVEKSGVLDIVRKKRFYEKPSVIRHRKNQSRKSKTKQRCPKKQKK